MNHSVNFLGTVTWVRKNKRTGELSARFSYDDRHDPPIRARPYADHGIHYPPIEVGDVATRIDNVLVINSHAYMIIS